MRRNNVFAQIGGLKPGRSVFDLSYDKKFTADMGYIIPILCEECLPGDVWSIGNEIVIRFQPLVAPVLHQVNVKVEYYFCPLRLLWPKKVDEDNVETGWEHFISGGLDGQDAQTQPVWVPTNADVTVGSLWDYFGFPLVLLQQASAPLDWPRRAYLKIWNDYYRDENLQEELDIEDPANIDLLVRAWPKDYFTSCMQDQQRGPAPAIPVTGTGIVQWPLHTLNLPLTWPAAANTGAGETMLNDPTSPYPPSSISGHTKSALENGQAGLDLNNLNNPTYQGTLDLGTAVTTTMSDFRLAMQLQKWMERNMRGGVRYKELLIEHWGVAPRDERLQRPECIGGVKQAVIWSEVLQTSQTTTGTGGSPQGRLAGHGITIDRGYVGKYRCTEYGVIMGLMTVMPKAVYQQGVNRQWLRKTRYDYPWAEFAHLSEQAVLNEELYATTVDADNNLPFGYQGRYNECRVKQSMVCAGMRSDASPSYDYWHFARDFGNTAPDLNEDFIKCVPTKRPFAVQNEHVMIVQVGNLLRAVRPLPIESSPGLVDHF